MVRLIVTSRNFVKFTTSMHTNAMHTNAMVDTILTTSDMIEFRRTHRPKRREGTLYKCGWESGRLAQHLFDDFLDPPEHDAEVPKYNKDMSNETTPADVLVFGGGQCGPGINLLWLQEYFPGTILFVNGESHARTKSTAQHSFMISSQATVSKNVYVPYAAMALVGMVSPHKWPILTLPNHARPRNTGEYYMIYANRNIAIKWRWLSVN